MKSTNAARITIAKDGPYLVSSPVSGDVPLAEQHIVTNAEGDSLEWREGKKFEHEAQFALCHCGRSSNKPLCDGSHAAGA